MAEFSVIGRADIVQVMNAFKSAAGAADDFAKQAQGELNSALSTAGTGFQNLQNIAGAAGVSLNITAATVVQMTADLYDLGASSQRAEFALNSLTDDNADQYIQAISDASNETISNMDAMAVSARALQLGVVGTSEEMAELTEVAIALGRIMGVDAKTALDDASLAIGRQSRLIADNLGIMIRQEAITEEANRLMAENADLTEDQANKQAFLNQFLEAGNARIAQMGGIQEDAASQTEQLTAEFDNLTQGIGETIATGLNPWLAGINDVIDATREHNKWLRDQKLAIAGASDSQAEYIEGLIEAGFVSEDNAQALAHLGSEYEGLKEEADLATEATDRNRLATEYNEATQRRFAGVIAENIAITEEGTEATEASATGLERAAEAHAAYVEAQEAAIEAAEEYLSVQEDLAGTIADTSDALSTMGGSFAGSAAQGEAFLDFLNDAGLGALAAGDGFDQLRIKYGLATEAQIELEHGLMLIRDALAGNNLTLDEASGIFDQWTSGQIDSLAELETAIAALADNGAGITEAMRIAIEAGDVEGMATAAAEGVAPLQTAFEETNTAISDLPSIAADAFPRLMEEITPAHATANNFDLLINKIGTDIGKLPGIAENAFSRLNNTAIASLSGDSGLILMADTIERAWFAWQNLMNNPHINLTADVTISEHTESGGGQARGGSASGMTLVGEEGPEIVDLPPGSYVHTAGDSRLMMEQGGGQSVGQMLTGNTFNLYFTQSTVTAADIMQALQDIA